MSSKRITPEYIHVHHKAVVQSTVEKKKMQTYIFHVNVYYPQEGKHTNNEKIRTDNIKQFNNSSFVKLCMRFHFK